MFTLDQVVPWGRSYDEYSRMFALTERDLQSRILGCADGPASFNAEATRAGCQVVSCDPIYKFDRSAIRQRIEDTFERVIEQTRLNAHEFLWNSIRDVEELGRVRMAAMEIFLDDYDLGKAAGRYIEAELPMLPIPDASFDLALCSHFLFLYSGQLAETFHHAAIREMCRVAGEVRIFPLLALGGQRSPHVDPCAKQLIGSGLQVSIESVPYEFRRGGHEMMRIQVRRNDVFLR